MGLHHHFHGLSPPGWSTDQTWSTFEISGRTPNQVQNQLKMSKNVKKFGKKGKWFQMGRTIGKQLVKNWFQMGRKIGKQLVKNLVSNGPKNW